jgi:hypothetical protein
MALDWGENDNLGKKSYLLEFNIQGSDVTCQITQKPKSNRIFLLKS